LLGTVEEEEDGLIRGDEDRFEELDLPAANAKAASASAGRAANTRQLERARSTASVQTVVLPMPGSPSITSPAAPPPIDRHAAGGSA
jgi:hypothetical protein